MNLSTLASTVALILPMLAVAEPFRPASPDTVLVRLPRISYASITAPLATPVPTPANSPRAPLEAIPPDPRDAVAAARRLVLAARHEADPRLLSRARLQLHPWWRADRAPTDVLLLRAEIRQGLHEFPAALADVDRALQADPRHPGAWLLKATLHQVVGDYAAAGHACLQLARFADPLTAVTATAALRGLTETNSSAADLLARTLEQQSDAAASVRAWANTTLGEIRARLGQAGEAEANFRTALELEPNQPYTLAALADLLLVSHRAAEVLVLLRDASPESLRLRLAEARLHTAPDAAETRLAREEIGESFALSVQRGDELHLREQSRFALRLDGNAGKALQLARRNWEIQKEPADLEVLLEAARAAGDTNLARETLAWAQRFQPAVLAQLAGPSSP